MKNASILSVFLVALLILCLPVTSFAAGELTPVRVTVRGVIYGTSGSANFYDCNVYSVSSDEFCIVPSQNLSGASLIRFYFYLNTNSWSSVRINLTFLDTRILLTSTDGSFAANVFLYNYSNGVLSSYLDASAYSRNTKSTNDGLGTFDFQILNSDGFNRNCIMVTCPLSPTTFGASSYYNFRVNLLTVDGVAVNDVAVTETNEGFAEDISNLSQNENEWWQRVVVPDYEQYLDDPDIVQKSSDYRLVIREISFNNFLVPGMITLVFIMAFYGFLLYGKKG